MTPQEQAAQAAASLGMDFTKTVLEHLDGGYIHSTPDCFVLAVDAVREFGDSRYEGAIFVTLAAGKIQEFLDVDPQRETRKWFGYCRFYGDKIRWIPYQRVRQGLARRLVSQN